MGSGGPDVGDGEGTSLETVLARKPSRRRQALRFAALIAALIAVSASLLRQYRAAQTVLPQSTPSGPGVVTVIQSNTTWGTLTVNGKRLPGPPPQTVTLYAFRENVVTLEASPFAPVTCQVDVVPLTDNGTPAPVAVTSGRECAGNQGQGPAAVGFILTGDDLPPAQRAAARQAITAALAAHEVHASVPAGEYYATGLDSQGRPISRQATAPLTATRAIVPPPLPYTPPPPTVAESCGDLSCGGSTFAPGAVPAGDVWSIQEPLFVQWHFADMTGTPVGEAAFGPCTTTFASGSAR